MTDGKLKPREVDMLAAVKTAHDDGRDGFITGRLFRRSTAEGLRDAGHLARIRVRVCDRWACGYRLTDQGLDAFADHVFPWELGDDPTPGLRLVPS